MRSEGKVVGSNTYRGENAVGKFLSDILREEEKIRESLATPEPIVVTWKDWENFKKTTDCHICNKALIKDEFVDSLPVCNVEEAREGKKWSYWGQGHKKMFLHGTERAEMGCSKA